MNGVWAAGHVYLFLLCISISPHTTAIMRQRAHPATRGITVGKPARRLHDLQQQQIIGVHFSTPVTRSKYKEKTKLLAGESSLIKCVCFCGGNGALTCWKCIREVRGVSPMTGVTGAGQLAAFSAQSSSFSSACCVGTCILHIITQSTQTHTKFCCHGSDMQDHNSTFTTRMEKSDLKKKSKQWEALE